jgi:hypothetical protein
MTKYPGFREPFDNEVRDRLSHRTIVFRSGPRVLSRVVHEPYLRVVPEEYRRQRKTYHRPFARRNP